MHIFWLLVKTQNNRHVLGSISKINYIKYVKYAVLGMLTDKTIVFFRYIQCVVAVLKIEQITWWITQLVLPRIYQVSFMKYQVVCTRKKQMIRSLECPKTFRVYQVIVSIKNRMNYTLKYLAKMKTHQISLPLMMSWLVLMYFLP